MSRYIDGDELLRRLTRSEADEGEPFVNFVKKVVEMRINTMPTADTPRWIPVTERLPEKEGYYLVSTDINTYGDGREVALFCKDEDGDYFSCEWSDAESVTAWMELPEPYKEKRE